MEIFNMAIHKYSHVVQNFFSETVCVYPSFSVHEGKLILIGSPITSESAVTMQVSTTYSLMY